jgi:hypothetical protein
MCIGVTLSADDANGLEGAAEALLLDPAEADGATEDEVLAAAMIWMGIVVLTLVSLGINMTWTHFMTLVKICSRLAGTTNSKPITHIIIAKSGGSGNRVVDWMLIESFVVGCLPVDGGYISLSSNNNLGQVARYVIWENNFQLQCYNVCIGYAKALPLS